VQEIERSNEKNAPTAEKQSTPDNETGIVKTEVRKQLNRMLGASKGFPISVSEQQFKAVETAHTNSINLLDNSASALLGAMEAMVPPADSGRIVGEYTAQGMRQLAKSICDIVQTKTGVVRSMYQISRDEI
jgi:hypothetical protein